MALNKQVGINIQANIHNISDQIQQHVSFGHTAEESRAASDVLIKKIATRKNKLSRNKRKEIIFEFQTSTSCTKCWPYGHQDHHHRHLTQNKAIQNVIRMTDAGRPFRRFARKSGQRKKRSNIHETEDSVLTEFSAKLLGSHDDPNNGLISGNDSGATSVIQVDCSCLQTHSLKVQRQEKGSRLYLQIHTGMCNNNNSSSSTRKQSDLPAMNLNAWNACIIEMKAVSMQDRVTGLYMDPIESHVKLRDGFDPDAPILASSSTQQFMINLFTEFLRIESVQESVMRGELMLTKRTDWESRIAFYVLAVASSLSVICIMLSFLYLSMSRRKNRSAVTLTTHTSPGSNSDNCPSSVSEVEEEERPGRRLECFEMDPYPKSKREQDNPVISNCNSSTATSVPMSSSSTV